MPTCATRATPASTPASSKPVRQTVLYECLVNVHGRPRAGGGARRRPRRRPASRGAGQPCAAASCWWKTTSSTSRWRSASCRSQGYTVTVANNGTEALDAHAQGGFDLMLMDCHMPEMDGFEATREIREREQQRAGKRMPIVALTANAMAQDREECLNAGMDDHLSKPFSMPTMQEMLERWMPRSAAAAPLEAAPAAARRSPRRRSARPAGARPAGRACAPTASPSS